jgi:hypothetical protein
MKLRTFPILYKGEHKILILDDSRTRQEGKLVAWVTARTLTDAMAEAKDVVDAILRNGKSLVWQ